MCETCACKLLELAYLARPLPDQQGDGRIYAALKEAAEIIRPIVSSDPQKQVK